MLFLSSSAASQHNRARVIITCDVLGKKHETVRYYHPIEGQYELQLSNFKSNKYWKRALHDCTFIDPRLMLTDSVNYVHANSLRYYIDPAQLIYVDWQMGHDSSNKAQLDTFKLASFHIRQKQYGLLVDDYFRPFYMKTAEVSNAEYREFLTWVMDSIFREAIYASDEFSDEEVFDMLVPEDDSYCNPRDPNVLGYMPCKTDDRMLNRQLFSFNYTFDYWKEFGAKRIIPIIAQFWLRSYYQDYSSSKRINPFHFIYRDYMRLPLTPGRTSNIVDSLVQVYPDTSVWLKDSPYGFVYPMCDMYFWHPFYDNYPVVGISWDQAKAFCRWKEQKLINQFRSYSGKLEVDLPRAYEYELATSNQQHYMQQHLIQDNLLLTDLLLDDSAGRYGQFHELLKTGLSSFTERIYLPFDETDRKSRKELVKKLKHFNKNNSNASDQANYVLYQHLLYMRGSQNYLPSGIEFLSNNVSEWMSENYLENYARLMEAYINYNCFASIDYCENQRLIDEQLLREQDQQGKMVLGANWFDERYETIFQTNVAGLYAKRFEDQKKSHSTVGFRYVVRFKW